MAAQAEGLAKRSGVSHRKAAAEYCVGILEADPELILLAAEGFREAERPLLVAKALEAAAIALADRGETAPARGPFTEADDTYASLGAGWDMSRLRARLREHGIRRGSQSAHRRARSGWSSLTPTEEKVAELVAEGLSNRQIADRMFLSPRTVGTHVSHILSKLGLRSRIGIARQGARSG